MFAFVNIQDEFIWATATCPASKIIRKIKNKIMTRARRPHSFAVYRTNRECFTHKMWINIIILFLFLFRDRNLCRAHAHRTYAEPKKEENIDKRYNNKSNFWCSPFWRAQPYVLFFIWSLLGVLHVCLSQNAMHRIAERSNYIKMGLAPILQSAFRLFCGIFCSFFVLGWIG